MNKSDLTDELQQDLSGAFPTSGFPYAQAAVLALHWIEDDFQPPCEGEVREIQELFSQKFFYKTITFQIPSTNSRNALEKAVVDFKFANDLENSLMIVYYSGHGDPDTERGKAVWAAKSQGGPTVDWFEIQRYLENTNADVLLIFDCCHASLATKDRTRGKLELLAATSGAGRTPCPGPDSFTRHLKEQLEEALSEKGSMQVVELHRKIDQRTRITPIHFNMRPNPSGSIILSPISQFRDTSAPLGAFTFTVSVTEVPTRNSIRQLGEWMKRTAPNSVSDISVDKIIDLSANLQSFLLDVGQAELKGRLIDSLDPEQKNALLAEMRKLTYDILEKGRISTSLSLLSSTIWPWDATSVYPSSRIGKTMIDRFESSVHRLLQSTWSIISKHPSFSDEIGLERLKHNETAKRAGISAAAGLSTLTRDCTHKSESEATFIPCENLTYRRIVGGSNRLSLASLENQSTIVEIIRSSDPYEFPAEGTSAQFAKTSSLLAQPKPEFYRILRCVGYTQDQDQWGRWFGLVFELPQGCSSYFTLEEQFTKNPRVALEKRYHLAYLIAFSISSLHDVNWVHKGIRSEDILFFGNKGDKSVTFDQPWLFGFEYTKEEPTNSNTQPDYRLHRLIYLPPSRWGVPAEKFTYEHDIYALGVLLLEIGFWRNLLDLPNCRHIQNPEQAQKLTLSAAKTDLPHLMGDKYAQAVMACLTTIHDSRIDRSISFRKDVLNLLWALID